MKTKDRYEDNELMDREKHDMHGPKSRKKHVKFTTRTRRIASKHNGHIKIDQRQNDLTKPDTSMNMKRDFFQNGQ